MRSVFGLVGGSVIGLFFVDASAELAQAIARCSFSLSVVRIIRAYSSMEPWRSARREIQRELPDFLDMLATTVEAGVGLNGALGTAVEGLEGSLGKELQIALQDIRLGRSRADALTAMANRVHVLDLTTTVTAIVQSERVGASITNVLDQLAAEARDRRLMRAEEIAGQLPNKLVFPMALCMLPALFIMIFGSVAAKIMCSRRNDRLLSPER